MEEDDRILQLPSLTYFANTLQYFKRYLLISPRQIKKNICGNTNLGNYSLRLFEIPHFLVGSMLGHRECLTKCWLMNYLS
jgi:hypothetical protein